MGKCRYLFFYALLCVALLWAVPFMTGSAQTNMETPLEKVNAPSEQVITPFKNLSGSTPEVRKFEEATLKRYQSNPDYQYDRPPEKPSYISRFFEWLMDLLKQILPDSGVDATFDILKYVLIALMIAILVSMLMNVPLNSLFLRRSARPVAPAYETIDENIHELDFDLLITEAVSQQDYRKAVRLNYLKTLKLLSDREVIAWEANKTNQNWNAAPFTNLLHKLPAHLTTFGTAIFLWTANNTSPLVRHLNNLVPPFKLPKDDA